MTSGAGREGDNRQTSCSLITPGATHSHQGREAAGRSKYRYNSVTCVLEAAASPGPQS